MFSSLSHDFFLIKRNAVDKDDCKIIRDWFDSREKFHSQGTCGGKSYEIKIDKNIKDSTDISLNLVYDFQINNIIRPVLNESFFEYEKRYPILTKMQSWNVDVRYNIQRYNPGGGFKVLHCENSGIATSKRILAWMIYLNNVKNGGTQFPYLNKKFKAREGTLLIWPAYFSHMHKGIPAKEVKYIATGWASFNNY